MAGLYDVRKQSTRKAARPAKDRRFLGVSRATTTMMRVTMQMVLLTYRILWG